MSDNKIKRVPGANWLRSKFPSDKKENLFQKFRKRNKKKSKNKNKNKKDEIKNHISELEVMINRINSNFEKKNSLIRFKIDTIDDEIIIDILKIDREGNIISVIQKNITHTDILSTVKHLEEKEGILLDIEG